MKRNGWHILRDGASLTLARHLPVRFDVVAETRLPRAGRLRVASQIRQDMWRALQRQRGFSPVVEITADAGGMNVRAGGRVAGTPCGRENLESRIEAVLTCPENRQRWVRNALGGME